MVMSMTGYGRSIMHIDDSDITVEIRSVNNRFADISVKMPRSLSYCEDKVKTELLKRVNRGKIDVFISYQKPQGEQVEIEPNISAARGYYDALKKIDAELGTHTEINANMLARFSDVFVVTREVPDEEKVWSDIRQVLTAAADNFNAMRAAEGEKMAEDVLGKIANVEELVLKVEAASEPRVEAYRNKLYNRLLDVLSNSDIDEKRILEEAAIYADRTAVDEETVRLHSHIGQFRDIVKAGGPVGRKLDFLVQEINREINTIGSKASDLEITGYVVDLKSEVEKIREQIQNIE
ncbi:MAG: YicC family protein [Oscillospiraceae bacterium]|nr:YicC family protein [Oscillospiraceae bacterium]MBQ4240770.1 YicC family protein [Oscillospiraceae bacterium]MBQ5412064.1 YicC family protein [Oscillospiraceae bacterium]